MNLLEIIVIVFMVLEISNVLALYSKPDFKYANAVGVFNAYKITEKDEEIRDFVQYLIKWVANTKVIFLMLLVVILIFGDDITKRYSVLALLISILMYYWKLHPIIKKMDKNDQITPKNYSRTLGLMILSFIILMSVAFLSSFELF